MAYEGWVIKIGKWQVPDDYIKPESYKIGLDKDVLKDFKDCDNKRHVIYAAGVNSGQTILQFETPENFKITNKEMAEFNEALESAKISSPIVNDETYQVTYYNPKTDSYDIKDFALDSMEYTVWGINKKEVIYSPVKFYFSEVAPFEY